MDVIYGKPRPHRWPCGHGRGGLWRRTEHQSLRAELLQTPPSGRKIRFKALLLKNQAISKAVHSHTPGRFWQIREKCVPNRKYVFEVYFKLLNAAGALRACLWNRSEVNLGEQKEKEGLLRTRALLFLEHFLDNQVRFPGSSYSWEVMCKSGVYSCSFLGLFKSFWIVNYKNDSGQHPVEAWKCPAQVMRVECPWRTARMFGSCGFLAVGTGLTTGHTSVVWVL